MSTVNTYSNITPQQEVFALAESLEIADQITVLGKYIDSIPLPANKSDTIKASRPNLFDPLTAPTAEGVTPSPQVLGYTSVQATLDQFASWVPITDRATDLLDRKIMPDAMRLLTQQAADTKELQTWYVARAGNQVLYANGSARSAVNTVLDRGDIRRAVELLKNNRARFKSRMLSAGMNIATHGIEAAYFAFGHTNLETTIRDTTGFVPISEYPANKALPYEIGSIEGVRIILSPMFEFYKAAADVGGAVGAMRPHPADATKAAVYPLVVCGEDSIAGIAFKGSDVMKHIVRNPGQATDTDPIGQTGSVAIKLYHKALITNEAWLVRIESAIPV